MSQENKDVPVLDLLSQLKIQREQFIQQKEITQNNLNQFVGAIYACDMMIKKHEEEEIKKQAGGQGNGEADNEGKEEAPQE